MLLMLFQEAGIKKDECVKPYVTVIVYTYFHDNPIFCKNDIPSYSLLK